MTLGPIVSCSGLSEHEVIGTEELAVRGSTNRVHRSRLQIDEHRTWDVTVSIHLVVVNVNPLQLEIRVAVIMAVRIDSMLVRDDFPKLQDKQMFETWEIEKSEFYVKSFLLCQFDFRRSVGT